MYHQKHTPVVAWSSTRGGISSVRMFIGEASVVDILNLYLFDSNHIQAIHQKKVK